MYDLAAELERRSDELRASWVVSPVAFEARIDLELVDDAGGATRLAADALTTLGLA